MKSLVAVSLVATLFSTACARGTDTSGVKTSEATPANVCVGVEETTSSDPHTSVRGVRVVLDEANATAEVGNYTLIAADAYVNVADALSDYRLVSKERFSLRFEHDDFGAYLHDARGAVAAKLIGSGTERQYVRELNGEQLWIKLSCAR